MSIGVGKFVGCVMIVIGTIIGSGILALPLVLAGAGFVWSVIAILASWAILSVTGLLVLEMALALPAGACTFSSMAEKTLGIPGRIATWMSCLLLLYLVVASYLTGASTLLAVLIEPVMDVATIPGWVFSLLFTLVFGAAVYVSTAAVDRFNRGLFSLKGFLLFTTIILVIPEVDISKLIANQSMAQAKYLLVASPIIMLIFNFQFVIPSLRMYVGDKPRELKWIVILGSTISLIIYLLWAAVTLGTVPTAGVNSFTSLSQLGRPADPSDFVKIITAVINNKWVTASVHGFFNVAMTTSFLGVSLGLFDFLADGLKRPDTRFGRLQTAGLTFVPPFLYAFLCPYGFMMAMNYSACFVATLCMILPAIMVYRLRKSTVLKPLYRVAICGDLGLMAIIVIGLVMFVLPILANSGLLPSLK
ncbi:MAG: tyrosine-specific transport protein [uncultured bacterium]|nr:MAG: tyrosine-specific transport protein [uncultured bacterium]